MYDGMVGDTDFSAAQSALQLCRKLLRPNGHSLEEVLGHSAGELLIYEQLKNHPWRVASSKDAKILVVPIAMTMTGTHYAQESIVDQFVKALPEIIHSDMISSIHSADEFCPGYNASAMFDAVVQGSLFHQRPKDHLFVDIDDYAIQNHFARGGADSKMVDPLNSLFAKQCTPGPWVDMDTEYDARTSDESCRKPNTLVAPFCPQEDGNPDNEARSVSMLFAGTVYDKAETNPTTRASRRSLFKHPSTLPNGTILITTDSAETDSPEGLDWPPCPNNMTSSNWTISPCHGRCEGDCFKDLLSHSQFALCPRGDNPTSQRMYDAVNFGAIPIFISDEAFSTSNPFQCFVPYNHISVTLPEAECAEDCGTALKSATSRFDAGTLHRTRQLIRHFRKDLLWKAKGSRVMENLLLTALQMRNPHGTNLSECCGTRCSPI
jgi:hypothetical protein